MKRKIKWKNVILLLLIIISFIIFIISIFNIISWFNDNNKTKDVIDKINDIVDIKNVSDDNNITIIEEKNITKTNPYWDYIKMNLIDVNLNDLKKENNDTVGWIQVLGTNINYPFVKTDNNDYYLTHSFDKNNNNAGWVFNDYRNKLDGTDKNLILYAHGRVDKTMFGSLKKIFNNGWLDNTSNHVIKTSSFNENSLWQVFSIYTIPNTNDYIEVNFNNDNFLPFLTMLKDRSVYDFQVLLTDSDQIITLSTCKNDQEKIVLHAKLIKKQIK